MILEVFHFDISGKYNKDEHPKNNPFISSTLLVFHFDISGKDINDEHLSKAPPTYTSNIINIPS